MKLNLPIINDMNVLENLKPVSKAIPYMRREHNGYWSLLTNNGDANYSMINRTGHLVLELCNGINTPLDILDKLSNVYPEVSRITLQHDLIKIFTALTQTNTIEWRNKQNMNENPFQFTALSTSLSGATLSLVMEHEIRNLSEFLVNALSNACCSDNTKYVWGQNYSEYTNPLIIRQCLYSYYKDFFVLKINGLIEGAVIIQPAVEPYINEAEVQFLSLPSKFVTAVMCEIIDYYAQFPYKKTNILHMRFPKAFVQENAFLLSEITKAGFDREAIQKRAYLNDDLYIYACEISHEIA